MARPALSAARALEIIDLMAASPKLAFTLSELVKLTDTNIASIHAILGVLVEHGHLVRHPLHKTYRLAPALFAIGESVAQHDPLLGSARLAVEALWTDTGLDVLLMGRAGGDIIGLARKASNRPARIAMGVGERVPLRPPLGRVFCAWLNKAEVEAWIRRGRYDPGDGREEIDRRGLALIRERGYLVALKSPQQQALESAFAGVGRHTALGRDRVDALMAGLYAGGLQPDSIEPGEVYDVVAITAPIFDAYGKSNLALSLSGFRDGMAGAEIERLATLLVDACARVMQENDIRPAEKNLSRAARAADR